MEIEKAAKVRAVTLNRKDLNKESGTGGGGQTTVVLDLPREELEKKAIRDLVDAENLWGLDDRQGDFATLFYELKEAVRSGKTGDDIAYLIRQNPLVSSIQKSLEEQQHRSTRDERDKWKETGESLAKGFDILDQVAQVQTEILKP
jgi:hypothetical protein